MTEGLPNELDMPVNDVKRNVKLIRPTCPESVTVSVTSCRKKRKAENKPENLPISENNKRRREEFIKRRAEPLTSSKEINKGNLTKLSCKTVKAASMLNSIYVGSSSDNTEEISPCVVKKTLDFRNAADAPTAQSINIKKEENFMFASENNFGFRLITAFEQPKPPEGINFDLSFLKEKKPQETCPPNLVPLRCDEVLEGPAYEIPFVSPTLFGSRYNPAAAAIEIKPVLHFKDFLKNPNDESCSSFSSFISNGTTANGPSPVALDNPFEDEPDQKGDVDFQKYFTPHKVNKSCSFYEEKTGPPKKFVYDFKILTYNADFYLKVKERRDEAFSTKDEERNFVEETQIIVDQVIEEFKKDGIDFYGKNVEHRSKSGKTSPFDPYFDIGDEADVFDLRASEMVSGDQAVQNISTDEFPSDLIRKVWMHQEKLYTPNPDYFDYHNYNFYHRQLVIQWMMEACSDHELYRSTFYLALNYLDRFYSETMFIHSDLMQTIPAVALFIAAKKEEVYAPSVTKMIELCCENNLSSEMFRSCEIRMMEILKWKLSPPTYFDWICLYLRLAAKLQPDIFAKPERKIITRNAKKIFSLMPPSLHHKNLLEYQFRIDIFWDCMRLLDAFIFFTCSLKPRISMCAAAIFVCIIDKACAAKMTLEERDELFYNITCYKRDDLDDIIGEVAFLQSELEGFPEPYYRIDTNTDDYKQPYYCDMVTFIQKLGETGYKFSENVNTVMPVVKFEGVCLQND